MAARSAAKAARAWLSRSVAAGSMVISTQGIIALSRKSNQPPLVSLQKLMTEFGPVISISRQAWSGIVPTPASCRARTIASLKDRGISPLLPGSPAHP